MQIQLLRADITSLTVDAIVAPSSPATLAQNGRATVVTGGNLGKPSLGCSLDRCARAMLRATLDYRARARSLHQVVFCLFGPEEHAAFDSVLRELES